MDSLFTGISKLVNGCMGEALVKNGANLMNGFFVNRGSKFANGYMGEALVKCVASFIHGFFVKRGV